MAHPSSHENTVTLDPTKPTLPVELIEKITWEHLGDAYREELASLRAAIENPFEPTIQLVTSLRAYGFRIHPIYHGLNLSPAKFTIEILYNRDPPTTSLRPDVFQEASPLRAAPRPYTRASSRLASVSRSFSQAVQAAAETQASLASERVHELVSKINDNYTFTNGYTEEWVPMRQFDKALDELLELRIILLLEEDTTGVYWWLKKGRTGWGFHHYGASVGSPQQGQRTQSRLHDFLMEGLAKRDARDR